MSSKKILKIFLVCFIYAVNGMEYSGPEFQPSTTHCNTSGVFEDSHTDDMFADPDFSLCHNTIREDYHAKQKLCEELQKQLVDLDSQIDQLNEQLQELTENKITAKETLKQMSWAKVITFDAGWRAARSEKSTCNGQITILESKLSELRKSQVDLNEKLTRAVEEFELVRPIYHSTARGEVVRWFGNDTNDGGMTALLSSGVPFLGDPDNQPLFDVDALLKQCENPAAQDDAGPDDSFSLGSSDDLDDFPLSGDSPIRVDSGLSGSRSDLRFVPPVAEIPEDASEDEDEEVFDEKAFNAVASASVAAMVMNTENTIDDERLREDIQASVTQDVDQMVGNVEQKLEGSYNEPIQAVFSDVLKDFLRKQNEARYQRMRSECDALQKQSRMIPLGRSVKMGNPAYGSIGLGKVLPQQKPDYHSPFFPVAHVQKWYAAAAPSKVLPVRSPVVGESSCKIVYKSDAFVLGALAYSTVGRSNKIFGGYSTSTIIAH